MSEKAVLQTEKIYTSEEYLKIERNESSKHEFNNGKILAVAGSNRARALLGSNITIAVGNRVHGQKNEIYAGNMRVRIGANRFSYPDVVVINTKPIFTDGGEDVLQNPTIIFEIYSKNTSSLDKTEKLELYLAMDSIREYLLVKEDEMRVEHYFKQNPKQWIYRIYNDREEIITLESVNCKVALSEIYSQVNFDAAGKPAGA